MGPGPPPKKGNRDKGKAESSRGLTSGGQGSSAGGSSAATTLVVGSIEGFETQPERLSGDGWNRRRYQRPDEMLWGFDIESEIVEEEATGISGISRSGTTGSGTYYTARNPAVNDLHPPVVSTHPTKKSETRWMLQPPPSAKIMEGKERANNRTRSISGGSHGSSKAMSLGRQVGERLMESKTQRSDRPPDHDSPPLSGEPPSTSNNLNNQGQRHDRDPRPSSDSKTSETSSVKKRPPPITISEDRGPNPRTTVKSSTSRSSTRPHTRPPLSTIPSSSQTLPTLYPSKRENQPPAQLRPPLLTAISTSSLHVLQELISPNSSLNMRAPSPSTEAGIRLPEAKEAEEGELRVPVCESWWPGRRFVFPGRRDDKAEREEVVERESGRWNMDI